MSGYIDFRAKIGSPPWEYVLVSTDVEKLQLHSTVGMTTPLVSIQLQWWSEIGGLSFEDVLLLRRLSCLRYEGFAILASLTYARSHLLHSP